MQQRSERGCGPGAEPEPGRQACLSRLLRRLGGSWALVHGLGRGVMASSGRPRAVAGSATVRDRIRTGPGRLFSAQDRRNRLTWHGFNYRQTRKSGAVGVDKVSAEEYAADLESNLLSVLDRFKSGTYFAVPRQN